MTDINSNINLNIDTQEALENIKNLQRQISVFHQQMLKSGNAANESISRNLQSTLMKNIDATGKFRTQVKTIQSQTELFTESLEKNKLSMGQYFRYAGASTKSFGSLFKREFDTINKVAIDRVKTLQTQYIKLGRDANGALKAIQVRPLMLDMDNLATKAAIAAQKQQLLNQLLKQGSTAMLNWGKNTQWAGRQLMVGFTIPLSMAGSAAAKAYMDIEKAAIKLRRVYGDLNTSSKDTEKMVTQIKTLAMEYTKYGLAVKDTMEMAAEAAATGTEGAALLAQVAQATRLAVLGQVEQSQALETTISLTNAFEIATDDLAGSIDFLNSVENQTVTSIEDLTIAIPKAAPVVKQLGGDVKDLSFFLTAMKEGGINASEGANALKSGLASMINPSKKASEFLAGFNINVKGIVEANKGDVKGTVIEMAKAFDTLDPLNRARAIEQLFGKFQFSRISTLFQNVIKEGSQASKVLELSKATQEELAVLSERELKKVEDSPVFKFQKAIEQIQAKLAPIGESFLKAITPFIDQVGKIMDGFNNMSDGAKQFATMATLVIAGIGPVALMTFGLIANGIANLIKMFATLKNFFNRTRGDTANLGDTTEYMTQQQLEAQAVAASLEESHAKLRQEFTLEAAAVKALTTEYERAVAAQAKFNTQSSAQPGAKPGANPTTPKSKPKKFASGGYISGPGTGTSDSIPIMASNGEVILSADTVAANPEMVNALLAGKTTKKFAEAGPVAGKPGTKSVGGPSIQFGGEEFTFKTEQDAKMVSHELALAAASAEIISDNVEEFKQVMLEVLKFARKQAEARGSNITGGDVVASSKLVGGRVVSMSGNNSVVAREMEDKIVKGNEGVVQAHATPQKNISKEEARRWGSEQIANGNDSETAREWANAQDDIKAYSNFVLGMPAVSNKDIMTGTENADWVDGAGSIVTSNIAEQNGLSEDDKGLALFRQKLSAALREVGETVVDESMFAEIVERALSETLDEAANNAELQAGANGLDRSRNTIAAYQTTGKGSTRKSVPIGVNTGSVLASDVEFGKGAAVIPGTEKSMNVGGLKSYDKIRDRQKEVGIKDTQDAAADAFMGGMIGKRTSRMVASGDFGTDNVDLDQYNKMRTEGQKDVKKYAVETGSNLVGGLSKGIGGSTSEANAIVENSAKGVLGTWKKIFGINSPAKTTEGFGKNLMDGLVNGIKSSVGAVVAAAKSSAEQVKTAINPSNIPGVPNLPRIEPKASPIRDRLKAATNKVASSDMFTGLVSNVKKGAAVAGRGITKVGQKIANSFMAGLEAQRAAANELYVQRLEVAREVLSATDAEYAAATQYLQAYEGKVAAGKRVTKKEQDRAAEALAIVQQKEQVIVKEIEASGEELDVIRQRAANARERDVVNDAERNNANEETGMSRGATGAIYGDEDLTPAQIEEQKKQAKLSEKDKLKADRKEKYSKTFGKVGKYAMGATMVTGTMSMVPGPVGEIAQQVTPVVGALSMMAGLITGPVSAALVALAVVVGGIWLAMENLKNKFNEAQKATLEMKNATGVSADSIQKLGEYAGKVSASEFMSQYNKDKAKGVFPATGKKTFGNTFVESDQGKSLVESYRKLKDSSGSKEVARDMAQQLSMAVVQGVLSDKQAKSIAANVAAELGDINISTSVRAQITELVGPNGEDFIADPVRVSAEFDKQALTDLNNSVNMMNKNTENVGTKSSNEAGQATVMGASAVGAATIGALVTPLAVSGAAALATSFGATALAASATAAAAGSVVPVVGTLVGAVVGLGIAWAVTNAQAEENAKKQGAMSGLVVANAIEALSMQKQQMDAIDAYYIKKIREAEQENRIADAKRLQLEYDQKRNDLAAQQASTTGQVLDAYASIEDPEALAQGVDKALETKFKDNAMAQVFLPGIKTGLDNLDFGDDEQDTKVRAGLQLEMLTGNMDPGTLANLVALMTSNEDVKDKFANIYTQFGGATAAQTASVISLIENPEMQVKILTEIEAADTETERDAIFNLLQEVQGYKVVKEVPVDVITTYYLDNDEAAAEAERIRRELESQEVTTVEQAYAIFPVLDEGLNEQNKDLFDETYFNSLKTTAEKETYISTVQMIYNVDYQGGMMNNQQFKLWYDDIGQGKYGDYNKHSDVQWKIWFSEAMGQKVTNESQDTSTGAPPAPPPPPSGGKSGPTAHWTDDVVKGLRDTVGGIKKLTTGIAASTKALKNFGRIGNSEFNGLSNQLRNAGASTEMMSKLLEDSGKNRKKFFKDGKLTALGLKVQASIYQVAMGDYVESQRAALKLSNDQAVAIRRLTAAGVEYAAASEMVQDAAIAEAIANGANAEQIKAIVEETKNRKATEWLNMSDAQRGEKIVEMYQANLDIIQAKEEEINKKYDERNEALDKIQAANENIKQQKQAEMNLSQALANGDLSAALKASDEMEALAASQAVQARKDAMDKARKDELAAIEVDINGVMMDRKQIEEEIAKQNIIIRDAKAAALESEIAIGLEAQKNRDAAANQPPPAPSSPPGGSGGGGGSDSPKSPASSGPKPNPAYKKAKDAVKAAKEKVNTLTKQMKPIKDAIQILQHNLDITTSQTDYLRMERELQGKRTQLGYMGQSMTPLQEALKKAERKLAATPATLAMGGLAKSNIFARGTDTVPAMLTPGEFIVSRPAVKSFGVDNLKAINEGRVNNRKSDGESVYNYNVSVNVSSNSDPDRIAKEVIRQIKQVDSQRVRGNVF